MIAYYRKIKIGFWAQKLGTQCLKSTIQEGFWNRHSRKGHWKPGISMWTVEVIEIKQKQLKWNGAIFAYIIQNENRNFMAYFQQLKLRNVKPSQKIYSYYLHTLRPFFSIPSFLFFTFSKNNSIVSAIKTISPAFKAVSGVMKFYISAIVLQFGPAPLASMPTPDQQLWPGAGMPAPDQQLWPNSRPASMPLYIHRILSFSVDP